MRFETLSEYDEEIEKIDIILDNFKEYINKIFTQDFEQNRVCIEILEGVLD